MNNKGVELPSTTKMSLPADVWRLILAQCHGYPVRFVCRQWRELSGNKKVMRRYLNTVPLIQWARSRGIYWGPKICSMAACCGYLEVLKYARQNGCPWDETTCTDAAFGGQLEVLKWAKANGAPMTGDIIDGAALSGNLAVICWALKQGFLVEHVHHSLAAMNGNARTLQALGFTPTDVNKVSVCSAAAASGNLEVVQWILNNSVIRSEQICISAAQSGHLEILKWAYVHGCSCGMATADKARNFNQTHILDWMRKVGLPC